MSISPKSPQAQVRFRDGDDLVEFEGSKKAPMKEPTETDAASRAKAKVRKTSKKTEDSTIGEMSSPVKSRKASASASEDESSKGRNKDKSTKGGESSVVKPPQPPPPPPPPPVRKLSININMEDSTRLSQAERSEELKLKYYSAFQTINRVHGGAIMKIKVGTAGSAPAKDTYPIFGVGKKFTCLHWDAECTPSDWCLAYHSDTPDWFSRSLAAVGDASASSDYVSQTITSGPTLVESSLFPLPPLNKALKIVKLSHITDIYVDSTSIRLYCDKEVIHLSPISAYNPLAKRPSCWADAVYSAQHMLQETPEYVMLYKTEFVSILAQHTLGDTRTVEVPVAQGQVPEQSDSTHSTLQAPLSPSRPGMLRRRSTLSAFFGVGASKPLDFGDEADPATSNNTATNTNSNSSANTAATNISESAGVTPESSSPRRKMSLLGAVKMVRGALKRSVSAPQAVFAAHKLERSSSGDSNNNSGNNPNGTVKVSGSGSGSVSSDAGRERSQSVHSVHSVQSEHSQSTFLSQNALSSLLNTGQISADSADESAHSAGVVDILPQRQSLPDALQMQIHALQEENRLLQRTLVDHNIHSPSLDLTDGAQHLHLHTTPAPGVSSATATYNTVATSPYTSDTEHSTYSTHSTHGSQSTQSAQDKTYTSKELSTLRAFTARSNFHQNKSPVKNTSRAFATSSNTNNNTSNISPNSNSTSSRTLTLQRMHEHYGPGSRPAPAPVAHVLGKQTVLDLLLAQTPINATTGSTATDSAASRRRSAITRTNNNIASNSAQNNVATGTSIRKHTLLHTIGDDYYNDTIELEPQQIAQLVELHKLHQEHARRAQLGTLGSSTFSASGSGALNDSGAVDSRSYVSASSTRNSPNTSTSYTGSTNTGASTGTGTGTGTSVVPALRMDENDCAVPVLEAYLTYDSDVYDNTLSTYSHIHYPANALFGSAGGTSGTSNGASGDVELGKRVVRDATSPIPRNASASSGSGGGGASASGGSASSSAVDLQAIAASSKLLPTNIMNITMSNANNSTAGSGTSSSTTNASTSGLGAGIQAAKSSARNTHNVHYNVHHSAPSIPATTAHPVVDFITSSDIAPAGQPRTTLKEQQARRSKVMAPVGQTLLQSMHNQSAATKITNTISAAHTMHNTSNAHSKATGSVQAQQQAVSAQREQQLLSILSGADATHASHAMHAAHNVRAANTNNAFSSDDEHKSATYRSRNNSSTSNSDHHAAVRDSNNANNVHNNTAHKRHISPQRKGYLARMAGTNNTSGTGGAGGSAIEGAVRSGDKKRGSVLGSGLLTHHTAHTSHTNTKATSSTHTTRTSRDGAYSADDSDHREHTLHTPHTPHAHTPNSNTNTNPNSKHGTHLVAATRNSAHTHYTTTEASDSDTLHYLKPPQWSNSYYYHGKHSPSKPKRSRILTEKDSNNPRFSPEKESKTPAAAVGIVEYTRIITALCTDGVLKCGLFHRTQLTVFLSAVHSSVFYVSEHGVVPYAAGLFRQDIHFLLLQSETHVLIVPLSGVAAAELDTNNTGLFKLSFTKKAAIVGANAGPGAGAGGGVLGRLIADIHSRTNTNTNTNTTTTSTTSGHANSNTTSRDAVSLVLKAEDTLALVDWLTVLLDLKYVPVK